MYKASLLQKAGVNAPSADNVTPIFESARWRLDVQKHLGPPINNANQTEKHFDQLQFYFCNLDD